MHLRDWLQTKRMKAADLSRALHIHQSCLTNYMSGKRPPSYEVVRTVFVFSEGAVGIMDWPEPVKRVRRKH